MTFVPARRALRPIGRWTFDFGLWTVLLVAAGVRLAFALRPPPFLTPDSQGYYLPGWELANGLGFGKPIDFTQLAAAPWIGLPNFSAPTFQADAIVLIAPVAVLALAAAIPHRATVTVRTREPGRENTSVSDVEGAVFRSTYG